MYLTVKEAAEYLSMTEDQLKNSFSKREYEPFLTVMQYLINKEQFNTYFKQMEKYKEMVEEYLSEPIPEDRDIKDED